VSKYEPRTPERLLAEEKQPLRIGYHLQLVPERKGRAHSRDVVFPEKEFILVRSRLIVGHSYRSEIDEEKRNVIWKKITTRSKGRPEGAKSIRETLQKLRVNPVRTKVTPGPSRRKKVVFRVKQHL